MATLLLVEDNPHIMKINAESLEDAGYKICEATSLEEAEEVLNKKLIHLIVLDIMLPDGNGVAFCKKIRKYCDIPILFLSAKNSSVDVIEGLHSGGDDYLSKPYNLQVLSARIESLLRRTKTVE
ncbi:MAG: response regulator, partial [Anaerovoracaceae bacterium]